MRSRGGTANRYGSEGLYRSFSRLATMTVGSPRPSSGTDGVQTGPTARTISFADEADT
jgi:hypothetical protein